MNGKRLRGACSALVLILTATQGPLAAARPGPALDGAPTPEACAKLGFESRPSRSFASGAYATMPPPPPPSPMMAAPEMRALPAPPAALARIAPPVFEAPSQRDTERYPNATANPVRRTAEAPVSTFSIDVDTASYANVRRFLLEGQAPPSDAVRIEELINYFDYDYAAPRDRRTPFSPSVAVVPSPWSSDREILHVGLQGYALPADRQPPLNLVFLIDTSGSMSAPDRLPLARQAMNVLVDQLDKNDRVSIVAYAGSAGAVLRPTDGRQKLMIRCALEHLSAGGSTAGGEGLELAYDLARQNFDPDAVNRVVLLTDGDFNVGIADPERLKDFVAARRQDGVYLSVYGFGRGNYNDLMMQALAQNGNGTAAYIDSLTEARRLFRDDLPASLFPIADDVKIQIEFNPAMVSEYRLIGYETRLLNREDFNNDQVDAGEVGSGAAVTALYEITRTGAPSASDPLRYGREARPSPATGDELAFLKVRFKPPGAETSQLISRPIRPSDRYGRLSDAPASSRWAVAVAAYGQKLRGDPWMRRDFDWAQIEALAQGARGADPDGARAEFITLVRAARDATDVRALN